MSDFQDKKDNFVLTAHLSGSQSPDQGGNPASFRAAGAEGASQLGPFSEEPDGTLDSVSV